LDDSGRLPIPHNAHLGHSGRSVGGGDERARLTWLAPAGCDGALRTDLNRDLARLFGPLYLLCYRQKLRRDLTSLETRHRSTPKSKDIFRNFFSARCGVKTTYSNVVVAPYRAVEHGLRDHWRPYPIIIMRLELRWRHRRPGPTIGLCSRYNRFRPLMWKIYRLQTIRRCLCGALQVNRQITCNDYGYTVFAEIV
jgi:hypothetical protein